jgi:hypothetical protein
MTRESPAWLAALKEGDRVVIEWGRLSGNSQSIVRVERLTATQIVVKNPFHPTGDAMRFRRDDGYKVAAQDRWSQRDRLVEATPEAVSTIRYRALAEKISKTDWKKQSRDVLDAVAVAVGLSVPNVSATSSVAPNGTER